MKNRYRRIYLTQYSLLALVLITAIGLVAVGWGLLDNLIYEDHFAIPWAAGRAWLLESRDPYGAIVGDEAYTALFTESFHAQLPETHSFTDPIFNLFFFLPFSLLPFKLSRAIWFALSIVIVGLIGYFSLKLSGWKVTLLEKVLLIGLFIISFTGVESFVTGRLVPLIVLLILVGLDALNRGKDTLAGFLFALTFGSITVSALVVVFILVWSISRRRWAFIKAYFAGLAFLWAISLLLLPAWPAGWLRANLSLIENLDWVRTPLMDLANVLPGIAHPLSLALHGIFAVILITMFFTTHKKTGLVFTWNTLSVLVLVYLFQIESSVFSLYLVFPALFLVLRFWSERWRIGGRVLSWIILVSLAIGTWLSARPEFSLVLEHRPVFMIAVLPILILMGMVTIRWWAIQIPRLPYEQI
jgi:hypothetical protein